MSSHQHVPGWVLCICGTWAPLNCPDCTATHTRLHHYRRRRMKKVARVTT